MPIYIECDEGEKVVIEVTAEYMGNGRQRIQVNAHKPTKGLPGKLLERRRKAVKPDASVSG